MQKILCLHVPSRLEGMETYEWSQSHKTLLVRLHVPSRLEGMETNLEFIRSA